MKKLLTSVFALLCVAALTLSALAGGDCAPIDQPDATYTGGTGKCSFGKMLFSSTNQCKASPTDSTVVATFSSALSIRQVPNGWATWSSPPDSESATPWVGFNQTATLTVTLEDDNVGSTVGTEIENNVFEPAMPVTVSFKDADGTEVASVTRDVLGRSGAKLFAVSCGESVIKSLAITASPGAQGFAIAQLRSDGFAATDSDDEISTQITEPREGTTSNIQ